MTIGGGAVGNLPRVAGTPRIMVDPGRGDWRPHALRDYRP